MCEAGAQVASGACRQLVAIDEQTVLRERILLQGAAMVEVIGSPVMPIATVLTRSLLTHLDANMVQLLHSEELAHVRIALIFVVLNQANRFQQ